MAAVSGLPIVERALDLAAQHPTMAAVHVLDAAMQGHHGQTIDFRRDTHDASFDDWLDPPSGFAELLRRAFGGHLPMSEVDCQSPAWEFGVIGSFAERYDVVPAGISDDERALVTHDGPIRTATQAISARRRPVAPSPARW